MKKHKYFSGAAKRFFAILMAEMLIIGLFCGTGTITQAAESENSRTTSGSTAYKTSAEGLSETGISADSSSDTDISIDDLLSLNGDVINGLYYFPMGKDTLSEYHYEDSYFYEPSTTYNESLAALSLALEIAAGEAVDNNNYTTGYADVQDFLEQLGFDNFEANESFTVKPTPYTIGAAMGEKQITLEDGSHTTLIALALRGAGYDAEWASNVCLGSKGEAAGFSSARYEVADFFNSYLQKYKDDIGNTPKVWIVGYSRSSAVADLFANYLNCAILDQAYDDAYFDETDLYKETSALADELNLLHENIYTYGFEMPAAAAYDTGLEASDNSNIWCHVDPSDPVPLVAPRVWEFYRYGNNVNLADISDQLFTNQLYEVSASTYKDWAEPLTSDFHVYSLGITNFLKSIVKGAASAVVQDYSNTLNPDNPILSRISGYSYLPISVDKEPKCGAESIADVLTGAVDLFASFVGARKNYSEKLESGISALLASYMGADSEGRTKISDKLCDSAVSRAKFKALTLIKDISIYYLPHFAWLSDGQDWAVVKLTEDVTDIATTALRALCYDNSTRKYIGYYGDAIEDEEFISALCTAAMDFAFWDYENNNGEYLGTLIHYAPYILGPHLLEVIWAYARANDPSYYTYNSGMQVITLTDDTDCVLEGLDVTVYENSSSGDQKMLARIINDKIYYTGINNTGRVSVSKNPDGKRIIYVYNPDDDSDYITCSIKAYDDDINKNISVHYLNWHNADNYTDEKEAFEDVPVPFTTGDELVISCSEANGAENLSKYITLYCKITDGDFKEINGVSARLCDSSGQEADTSRLLVTENTSYYVEADSSDEYKFLDMAQAELDEDGNIIKNENGRYQCSVLNASENSTFVPDINTTSMDVYFRFRHIEDEITPPSEDIYETATGNTVTFKGTLYDPVNGPELEDKNLKYIYTEDLGNPYSVKVLSVVNPSEQSWFFIKAPDYTLESGMDLVFDHWSVTHTETGSPWGQEIKKGSANNATRFYYDEENNRYVFSGAYNPDGSEEQWMCINNVDGGSMTLIPIYRPAEYTYTVILSDGSEHKGTAAMGDKVSILNSKIPEDMEFTGWKVVVHLVMDETGSDGQPYRKVDDPQEADIGTGDEKAFTFTMPRGDVEIYAEVVDVPEVPDATDAENATYAADTARAADATYATETTDASDVAKETHRQK